MKLRITNLDSFIDFINCASKLVPSCKFEISTTETKIYTISDNKTIRLSLNTNALISKETDCSFCFQEITKLARVLSLIKDTENINECDLEFNNTFIMYNNSVNFKLKVAKSDIIEKYISKALNIQLQPIYTFKTTREKIKQIISQNNVIFSNSSESKLYFSKNNNNFIVAEIDNKNNTLSDSIGIPIGELIFGDVSKTVSTTIDNFKAFNLLDTEEVYISLTDKNVFEVKSSIQLDNNCYINMYMINSILKG